MRARRGPTGFRRSAGRRFGVGHGHDDHHVFVGRGRRSCRGSHPAPLSAPEENGPSLATSPGPRGRRRQRQWLLARPPRSTSHTDFSGIVPINIATNSAWASGWKPKASVMRGARPDGLERCQQTPVKPEMAATFPLTRSSTRTRTRESTPPRWHHHRPPRPTRAAGWRNFPTHRGKTAESCLVEHGCAERHGAMCSASTRVSGSAPRQLPDHGDRRAAAHVVQEPGGRGELLGVRIVGFTGRCTAASTRVHAS